MGYFVICLNSFFILGESRKNNPIKQIKNIGVINIIPAKPCPVWSFLINHIVSTIKKLEKTSENQNMHFLARLFNTNNPTLKINITNPQIEYDRQIITSLQPWEEGKKNIMEINPRIANSMEYNFINIFIILIFI